MVFGQRAGQSVIRQRGLVSSGRRDRRVRVSCAAVLRIRDDHTHLLFHANSRPGAFTPPGGVFKYAEPAADLLDRLGFRPERWTGLASAMRADLRGFIPVHQLPEFQRWFSSGAYRESSEECLVRELVEELGEVGYPEVAEQVGGVRFNHLRTVVEGPAQVPHKPYQQLRYMEFYDLVCTDRRSLRFRTALFELAADEEVTTVIGATPDEILYGRSGRSLITPHAAYLVGEVRTRPDLPPIR